MKDRNFSGDGTMLRRVRELRHARPKQVLTLAEMPHKAANHQPGVDPYNTSGSFDRKNNWVRVGKR